MRQLIENARSALFMGLKALAIADLEEEKNEFADEGEKPLWGPGDDRDLSEIREAEELIEVLSILLHREILAILPFIP